MNANNLLQDESSLPLVDEERFQLYLNGIYYSDFLCTPDSLKELVIGNLYINDNIHAFCDIENISIYGYKIEVETSDCINKPEKPGLIDTFAEPELQILQQLAELMFAQADIYHLHGGIHCSALSDGREIIAFNEDIGRHNAFDKVVGKAVADGRNFSNLVYITSGRVNQEVMNKAAACGIPLIVSRSIMSSAAFKQAKKCGINVIGRILYPEPVFYRGSNYRCLAT